MLMPFVGGSFFDDTFDISVHKDNIVQSFGAMLFFKLHLIVPFEEK
jgi:hypothetical protein